MKGHGRVIYALCPANIPAERAFAWAKGVLGQLQPEQVIVQTSLSVGDCAIYTLSCPSSSAFMMLTEQYFRLLSSEGTTVRKMLLRVSLL